MVYGFHGWFGWMTWLFDAVETADTRFWLLSLVVFGIERPIFLGFGVSVWRSQEDFSGSVRFPGFILAFRGRRSVKVFPVCACGNLCAFGDVNLLLEKCCVH